MTPSVVGTPLTITGAAGTSAAFNLTTLAPLAGERVIVFLYKENTAAVTAPDGTWAFPSGFAAVSTTAPQAHYIYEHLCLTAETATVTFSWAGSVFRAGVAFRVSGGGAIVATNTNFSNTGVSATPNVSLPAVAANALLLHSGTNFVGGNSYSPPTVPATFTELADLDVLSANSLQWSSSGATGNVSSSMGLSGASTAILAEIDDASSSPTVPLQIWPQPLFGPWPRTQLEVLPPADLAAVSTDLDPPLLGAYGDSSTYWQIYNAFVNSRSRAYLEVGQRRRDASPDQLGQPLLENELLGGATDLARRLPATHADRREYPQQRLQLADQSSTAAVETDSTQSGDGPQRLRWRRDPIPPLQRQLESVPGMLDTALLENELLGGATTGQRTYLPATHADRREYPQQTLVESAYGLLDQAQLEITPPLPITYGLAATHQRLPWLRIKQQQYDQSAAAIITDLDPTQSGGYGSMWRWWYRPLAIPQQRQLESPYGLLDAAQLEVSPPLSIAYGLAATHQRLPWLRIKQPQYDQSAPPIITDLDPTQAGGYGFEWRWWYRAPAIPLQRQLESVPGLLDAALLEASLLGGWDDLARHRAWYVDRREVPQQRSSPAAFQPLTVADPLLVSGAEWRYRLIPATHKTRWALRQWWQQKTFPGSPLLLFEGTVVGGVRGGPGAGGGARAGAGLVGSAAGGPGAVGSAQVGAGLVGSADSPRSDQLYGLGLYGIGLYPGGWIPGFSGGRR